MAITHSDLSALAQYYADRGSQRVFQKLVKDMSDAASANADIRNANDMHRSIASSWKDQQSKFDFYGRAGIQSMCVILYGRAAKIRNGAIGSVNLAPSLSDPYRSDHEAIMNLRDDAIAHLGPGKRGDQRPWWKGALTFRFKNGRPDTIGMHQTSRGFDPGVHTILSRLLPEALKVVRTVAQDRSDALMIELHRLSNINPNFWARLQNTLIDLSEFYEDLSAVRYDDQAPGETEPQIQITSY